ncbi:hypothetical protein E2C01_075661 [Portunus trituberculatus]|uniref:Uncharacterized protein n=1 Tax=Portunus trituberculatus TaxID=210409 RepID=A0A5B7I6N2_PORTR|nr:hypothetical protein [Portunus trituberculatus]
MGLQRCAGSDLRVIRRNRQLTKTVGGTSGVNSHTGVMLIGTRSPRCLRLVRAKAKQRFTGYLHKITTCLYLSAWRMITQGWAGPSSITREWVEGRGAVGVACEPPIMAGSDLLPRKPPEEVAKGRRKGKIKASTAGGRKERPRRQQKWGQV